MSNNPQPTGAAEKRRGYTEGLRALADLLDQNHDIPLPDTGQVRQEIRGLHIYGAAAEPLAQVLGRPHRAEPREKHLWLEWHLSGLSVVTLAPIDLCEERTVGFRRVDCQEVPVTETVIPERFRPVPAEAVKVGA